MRLDTDSADLRARLAEARAEAVALRGKNHLLHRRAQSAEAGLLKHVDRAGGRTLGRALANSAATMYREQLSEARAEIARATAERDATQRENAELRRRLAEMVERASEPRGTYRPGCTVERADMPPIEWDY